MSGRFDVIFAMRDSSVERCVPCRPSHPSPRDRSCPRRHPRRRRTTDTVTCLCHALSRIILRALFDWTIHPPHVRHMQCLSTASLFSGCACQSEVRRPLRDHTVTFRPAILGLVGSFTRRNNRPGDPCSFSISYMRA